MSLVLADVWFRYSDAGPDILRGVNLRVAPGQSCALMAPSGEGKSTLLSIAAGMLRPTSGHVSVDADAKGITWMFQGPAVLPRRTAQDNVALPLIASNESREDARRIARAALDLVGLSGYAESQVRHLSGGQVQRVAIARALVARPAVVLADEPTASLDYDTAHAVSTALLSAMSGAAVLVATHDIRIASLMDRTVCLDHGVLVEDAS